jgi:hypothetical protein
MILLFFEARFTRLTLDHQAEPLDPNSALSYFPAFLIKNSGSHLPPAFILKSVAFSARITLHFWILNS